MFRNTCFLSLVLGALLSTSFAQAPAASQPAGAPNKPIQVLLADGTPVKLRMGSTSTGVVRVGENLELEVVEDVRVGNVVVIAKGNVASSEVTGQHANAETVARYDISLRSVMLSDGEIVPVRAAKNQSSRPDQTMIISSASQDASISPDTTVIAYVNGTQTLDLTRLRAASGPTQTLKITSTPPNADVSVDGRMAGNTPYIFRVPAGDHTVAVRMAGYRPAQQTVHISSEPVVLELSLTKQDGAEAAPTTKAAEPSLGDLARAARARKAQQSPAPASGQPGAQPARDPMVPPSDQ